MDAIKIWPGDFFSTKGNGIPGWANEHLTKTPSGRHTDRFHFGIIGDPIFDDKGAFVDFETRESISKGLAPLRFFQRYTGNDVELYRIPGITPQQGRQLFLFSSEIGAARYAFKDFAQALVDVACLMITMQFPPYTADQFKISESDEYICTEAAAYDARRLGKPIEDPHYPKEWVIPVVYRQAREEGRLGDPYYHGDLKALRPYIEKGIWRYIEKRRC